MGAEKFGTEQLKKILLLVIEGGNIADKVINEKGGISAKIAHLMGITDELFALNGLDLAKVKDEWSDLSLNEKAELVAAFKVKFDLAEDALEAKIEEGFALAVEGAAFVDKVISFAKALQA